MGGTGHPHAWRKRRGRAAAQIRKNEMAPRPPGSPLGLAETRRRSLLDRDQRIELPTPEGKCVRPRPREKSWQRPAAVVRELPVGADEERRAGELPHAA